jgi:RNA 2',3'-cyclic 3'-phosphodiesterase
VAGRAERYFDRAQLTTEPRLFFAAPLDDAARAAVAAVVEGVRAEEPPSSNGRRGVRWVRLDGLHLTLRFLGPTDEKRVPDLLAALDAVGGRSSPFGVRIAGAGGFPSESRPRTVWLGVTDGASGLAELAARVDDALESFGWPRPDRPFRAHLTLARSDGVPSGPAVVAALKRAIDGRSIESAIDRIVLFESVTGGGPARYVSHREASLG